MFFEMLGGRKKNNNQPPSTLQHDLLWRFASCKTKTKTKNNPAFLIERFDVHFCPCIKAGKKAVCSLKVKLYLLLPAHPTVAS